MFRDLVITGLTTNRAKDELRKIDEIIGAEKPAKEKCRDIWRLIRGEQPARQRKSAIGFGDSMPVLFAVAKIQARLFGLTTGQIDLLKADSVASGALLCLQELNILPQAVEEVVTADISRSRALNPH